MKIIHYGLSANKGGIETYLFKLSKSFLAYDCQFFFIDSTTNHNAAFRSELISLGSQFIDIKPRKVGIITNFRNIISEFKRIRPDILHFHVNNFSYIAPVLVARLLGIKVIIHSRNAGQVMTPLRFFRHFTNKFVLNFYNFQRIAVSKEAGRWLFNGRYKIIHNSIDLTRFEFHEMKRLKLRQVLSIPETSFVFLMVGALIRAKNHKFGIAAFDRMVKEYSELDVRLIIIGNGELEPIIREQINYLNLEKHINLQSNTDQIEDYYCAADCLLMPSLFEGFPNVVQEAKASGLPCILSDRITRDVDQQDLINYVSISSGVNPWSQEMVNCVGRTSGLGRLGIAKCVKFIDTREESDVWFEIYSNILKGKAC